ncbi:MAG: CDP-diacylglycerol--serine O-phosphatidyltransferase [Flavobacteriales bacterium]|nr:CDP-diacylglycerol--serine O-phosphatidyltransferase [Flavobacteriales bacterium]
MNAIKRNIPNIITLANLTCGLFAILFAFEGSLVLSASFIFYGAFLDFFDGLAARLLNVSGELGKQLDSMADMVTFGVAPGSILYYLIEKFNETEIGYLKFLAFLIPIFSAIRLAKFNIDIRQTSSFIGLPTPALAIFIAAVPLINFDLFPMFIDLRFLIAIAVIMPLLLVAEIPLFSLKISQGENLTSKLNILRITLILAAVVLLFVFQFAAIPFIVILYLILSILNNIL